MTSTREAAPMTATVSTALTTVDQHTTQTALCLDRTLLAHRVDGSVVDVVPGPRVTRYDVRLAPGTSVNRVLRLRHEIALAVRAPSVSATLLPDQGVVGIEVPNATPRPVSLTGIMVTEDYKAAEATLPVVLGVTSTGSPMVTDLAEMPHLLVAGATGSGKSVALHGLISSLAWARTPEEVQFILIDPKMVEFSVYATLPHLRHGIVTTVEEAVTVLRGLEAEMDRRYAKMQRAGARHVSELADALPSLVVVIDELADLILTKPWGKAIETSLVRLAQKSRACGIHLVAATQRPQAKVVTGLIKANFPSRLAFRVASAVDSRVILDQNGAEALLGQGDLLFSGPGMLAPLRGQGAYVETRRIALMVQKLGEQFASVRQDVGFFRKLWRELV